MQRNFRPPAKLGPSCPRRQGRPSRLPSAWASGLAWLGVLLLAGLANGQPRPDGGRAGTDGGSFCLYDGGPGGCCANDSDCLGCGWVCSWARGGYCIPSMEGDPGHCTKDSDCACVGQSCSGNHCSPAASPACRCNADCPSGQICDQLTFSCHAQPTSCTYLFGSCGCGFYCNADPGVCVAGSWLPPECASDLDCNVCETGNTCVLSPVGLFMCTSSDGDGGWCAHSPGGGTTGGGGSTGGSPSSGSGGGTGGSVGGTRPCAGCSSSARSTSLDSFVLLAMGLGLTLLRRRKGFAVDRQA